MAVKVLPDTSFLVSLLRGEAAAVDAWEAMAAEGAEPYLSSVVLSELRYGFVWQGDRLEEALFEGVAMEMPDAVFDDHAAAHAAELQVAMARLGKPLSDADAFVAGTAVARRMVLVTADKVMARVKEAGLPVRTVPA